MRKTIELPEIRKMLASMNGSGDIPRPLRKLRSWANKTNIDGPRALTQIRNIVHASRVAEVLNHPDKVRFEVSELALFYFETAMLHICNVPWAQLSGRLAPVGGRWSRWRNGA